MSWHHPGTVIQDLHPYKPVCSSYAALPNASCIYCSQSSKHEFMVIFTERRFTWACCGTPYHPASSPNLPSCGVPPTVQQIPAVQIPLQFSSSEPCGRPHVWWRHQRRVTPGSSCHVVEAASHRAARPRARARLHQPAPKRAITTGSCAI